MDNKYLPVSAITKYLKYKFATDDNLKIVFIKGEISNYKKHSTGHLYFSIKDENSKIDAIMFNKNTSKLKFIPQEGIKVLVIGRISIYETTGRYQIYVEHMQEDGIGNLYQAFEKLKEQLKQIGYFDKDHKLPIPKYPNCIGVVTAKTGAAVKDIITTIKRRYPIAQIILFPSLVQGESAAKDIVKNIKYANTCELDVLIIGRGGGSIEDLWPFNEQIVAKAIYESKIPIISAVGHETDFTISDFVADLRAPTPTSAAELAVPNVADIKKQLEQFKIRLHESLMGKINYNKLHLETIKNSFILKNPLVMLENRRQKLDYLQEKINNHLVNKINIKKTKLINLIEKLQLVNPLDILKKGYTLIYQNNQLITNFDKITKNTITIKTYHHELIATIEESRLRNGKSGKV
ncbi:MAG: exodeoxyribonuclease VII large subunit [Bacilli bacterium]